MGWIFRWKNVEHDINWNYGIIIEWKSSRQCINKLEYKFSNFREISTFPSFPKSAQKRKVYLKILLS